VVRGRARVTGGARPLGSEALLAEAADVRAREHALTRRQLRLVADRAYDGHHPVGDHLGLRVHHKVITAKGQDVNAVARQAGELGVQHAPQALLRSAETWR
jgi:hypothetical protein